MKLKTLIVDDEELARERLRFLLKDDPRVEIVKEARNADEAIAAIKLGSLDLVLLDIEMPSGSGFDVVDAVGTEYMPITVFTTAYNDYALKAFQVQALDYLTKPIEPPTLAAMISRVQERYAANCALALQKQLQGLTERPKASGKKPVRYPERLLVPNGSKDILIAVRTITWIEAADYYARIHVSGKAYTLRQTIKELSSLLHPNEFVRIHRSTIVNIRAIAETLREGPTDAWVILNTGERLKMSKSGWADLLAATHSV